MLKPTTITVIDENGDEMRFTHVFETDPAGVRYEIEQIIERDKELSRQMGGE